MPYLPYIMVSYYKNRRGLYDPNNPRDSNALLEGWSLRAKGAEINCWEALTAYLAFSWIAHAAAADPDKLAWLGLAWVVSRLVYIGAYVAGVGLLRIAAWCLGVLFTLARLGIVFLH